jgi:hypothetical protein
MAERTGRTRAFTLAGEALAIGLGVFLSLWADEWRTNRNVEADSRDSLARVAQNLSSDTSELARLSDVNQRRVDAIRALLTLDPDASDASARMADLIPFALESSLLQPSGHEYEALKGSGRLGLVANAELLSGLAQYYELREYVATLFALDGAQSQEVAELIYPHVEFPRDVFTPETRPSTTTLSTPSFIPVPTADPSVVSLLSDRVFVNETTEMGRLKQLVANALNEMMDVAREAMGMIETELES